MGKTREALLRAEKEYQNRSNNFQENLIVSDNAHHLRKSPGSREKYQEIKTKLNIKFPDKSVKTILFTSGDIGNGTTTNAIGLARALSMGGQSKVFLIDANMRSPQLHKVFNIENKNGLSKLLLYENEEDTIAKQVGNSSLCILPVGKMNSEFISLFESENFTRFLKKIRKKFDYVIIDSPPINGYAETLMIAKKVDGVILSLESGKSRKQVAIKAKQQIDESGAKFIGVIMNRRKYYIPRWVYKRL